MAKCKITGCKEQAFNGEYCIDHFFQKAEEAEKAEYAKFHKEWLKIEKVSEKPQEATKKPLPKPSPTKVPPKAKKAKETKGEGKDNYVDAVCADCGATFQRYRAHPYIDKCKVCRKK